MLVDPVALRDLELELMALDLWVWPVETAPVATDGPRMAFQVRRRLLMAKRGAWDVAADWTPVWISFGDSWRAGDEPLPWSAHAALWDTLGRARRPRPLPARPRRHPQAGRPARRHRLSRLTASGSTMMCTGPSPSGSQCGFTSPAMRQPAREVERDRPPVGAADHLEHGVRARSRAGGPRRCP